MHCLLLIPLHPSPFCGTIFTDDISFLRFFKCWLQVATNDGIMGIHWPPPWAKNSYSHVQNVASIMDCHSFDVLFSSRNTSYPLVNFHYFGCNYFDYNHFGYIHILARLVISILLIPSIIFPSLIPSLLIILSSLALPFSIVVVRIIIWLWKTLFLLNLFN